jgi:hypothetical protein
VATKLLVLSGRQGDPWPGLWESFERSLRANRASPQTLRMYREAGSQAHAYFREWAMPTDPVELKKAHIEAWLIYLVGF